MKVEVITIGDELCRGEIVNTNASWLAAQLWEMEVQVSAMLTIADEAETMQKAIQRAAERCDFVLLSGGLGPTSDDLTLDVLSELTGRQPEIHAPSEERMRERFEKLAMPVVENATRQVRYLEEAEVFFNPVGLAPGVCVPLEKAEVIALPGPPRELHGIFLEHVRPKLLAAKGPCQQLSRKIFRAFGKGESQIAEALKGLALPDNASLHYQVKFPEVLVKLVVRGGDKEKSDGELERLSDQVYEAIGGWIYGEDDDSLPASLGRKLIDAGQTVATAESCTGGMIGSLLTDMAGSSAFFLGGAITYSNEEKIRQLGVLPETLNEHGAVSEEVVRQMAEGISERSGADWGISVSGVAGPGGGSEDKPVGTVWIGLAGPKGTVAKKLWWPGSRERVRVLAAHWALHRLWRSL